MASGSFPAACTVGVHAPAAPTIRATRARAARPGLVVDEHERNQPRLSGIQPFFECRHIRQPSAVTAKGSSPGKPLSTESCSMAETSTG